MSNELVKKLRLASCKRALILNAPEGYIASLGPLPEDVQASEQKEADHAYNFVQVFLHSAAEVQSLAPIAIQAVAPDGLLWMCYPKGTGKIKTDINRDSGWQPVYDLQYEGVSLISLDDTWSAMRFRHASQVKAPRSQRTADRSAGADKAAAAGTDKTVVVPDDLAAAFAASPEAFAFYETLSYTNRKEYVRWITDAKREETRRTRVEKTIDKLSRGVKNPTLKE